MTRASSLAGPGGGSARIASIGLSHKTAPVEQREKASLGDTSVRAVLRALGRGARPLSAGAECAGRRALCELATAPGLGGVDG
jgi:hypothetical protein